MDRIRAYEGAAYTIAFARQKNGRSPGAEFFDALPVSDQVKLDNLFRLLGDQGRIVNKEKFKVLEKGLFEFKSFQIRMLCAYAYAPERHLMLISHGFTKQKDRTPKAEIERAWRILGEDREQVRLSPDKEKKR